MDYTQVYDVFEPPNPSKCVLILLPGACGTRQHYIYTSEFLSQHFTVIAMDLPGLGARSNEKLSAKSATDAINDVVNSPLCHNKRIVLLGYSMGGYIALKFVQQFPKVCKAVILGGCMNELSGLGAEAIFGGIGLIYSVCSKETLASFVPDTFAKISKDRMARAITSTVMNYSAWDDCVNTMLEPHEGFYRLCIGHLPKTLWIQGEHDRMDSKDAFLSVGRQINFNVIPGGDHLCMLDQRTFGVVHKLILDFLEKIEAEEDPKIEIS